uniref:MAT1-2-1 n=1 Tax=Diplocarpon coronariae TaxID=2795749 RepID=A0A891IU62_9HELO|nr:MAT1-2-1 [Marssonina coronariae]
MESATRMVWLPSWSRDSQAGMLTGEFIRWSYTYLMWLRCNKLPRVFLGPKSFFDRVCRYVDVAGDIPIIVDGPATDVNNRDTEQQLTASARVITSDELAINSGNLSDQTDQVTATDSSLSVATAPILYTSPNNTLASSSIIATTTSSSGAVRRPARAEIPRPMNCFIIFRTQIQASVARDNPHLSNIHISQIISQMWKTAPAVLVQHYKGLAQKAKEEHALLYPDYAFRPRKSSEKKRRMTKKKIARIGRASANTPEQLPFPTMPEIPEFPNMERPTFPTAMLPVNEWSTVAGQSDIGGLIDIPVMEPQGQGFELQTLDQGHREDFAAMITAPTQPDDPLLSLDYDNATRLMSDFETDEDRARFNEINGPMAHRPLNFGVNDNYGYEFIESEFDTDLASLFFSQD